MSTATAAVQVSRLMRALPKEPLPPPTFAVYVEELATLRPDLLESAVGKIIRSRREPWFPTVGEIITTAMELWLCLPTEGEALAQVDARIQWGRERAGEAPAVHPLVAEALGQVGGYVALRESEEPRATRGRFSRVYRDLRAAAIRGDAAGLGWAKQLDSPGGAC